MAFDREAAKAAGYSDEEINGFLQANPQAAAETPAPPSGIADQPPAPTTRIGEVDRTAEMAGTAAAVGTQVLPYVGAAAAGYGLRKVLGPAVGNVVRNMVAPAPTAAIAPTPMPAPVPQPSMILGPNGQPMMSQPPPTPQAAPQAAQTSRFAQMASRYGPAMARLGTGLGMMLHSRELNANEDQQLAEIRRRMLENQNNPTPNAINSGYSQQIQVLENKGKRNPYGY